MFLYFYKALSYLILPILLLVIFYRILTNKEDPIRYKEKFLIYPFNDKNNKNKEVIWIHAASIGEVNSVLPLIRNIVKTNNDIFIILTSTTLTSSLLIKKFKISEENFFHCFFPFDYNFLIKKFLNYWNPKLVIFVDSEVWPVCLSEIKKRDKTLILLNGRITNKTLKRWKFIPNLSKSIFSLYDLCLASSKESEKNLNILGAKNVKFLGNIKFCAEVKSKNYSIFSKLEKYNFWCAASTHEGEEIFFLKTQMLLMKNNKKFKTIIIPRHINRSEKILSLSKRLNLKAKIFNDLSEEMNDYDVLIINSVGDMVKYYSLCRSIFMGKSLVKKLIKVGGQNPIEPAKCGCKIYHGPYVSNFEEIYNFLASRGITTKLNEEKDLEKNLLKDYNKNNELKYNNLEELNNYGSKLLNDTTNEVINLKNEI